MKHFLTLAALATGLTSSILSAQTASPIQSPARPFHLDIVDTVKVTGSDAAAAKFNATTLPGLLKVLNSPLYTSQAKNSKNINTIGLKRDQLKLDQNSTIRAYFLGENTGPSDSLGISTTGGSPVSKDSELIFPNISQNYNGIRTSAAPLQPGDFVDLGTFIAGTQLDFFLIAGTSSNYVSTNPLLNKNRTIHALSYLSEGSTYLMLAFEDDPTGGDWDFNDFTMALEITPKISAPEPSLAMGSMIAAVSVFGLRRRKHRKS